LKGSLQVIIESNSIPVLASRFVHNRPRTHCDSRLQSLRTRVLLIAPMLVILHETRNGDLAWKGVSLNPWRESPCFRRSPPTSRLMS
jgi:hypothetical protein